ncbi:hypothetical protein E2C01_037318 [Portunus trituberculatus]|uniref:Uncharacterized protein n=1 Tax=Portunus trituberculatus TaxID=210409 RepID=A0A5B7FEC2_PORTR|nr:hypothetical protein [Portunus trituberculatus]
MPTYYEWIISECTRCPLSVPRVKARCAGGSQDVCRGWAQRDASPGSLLIIKKRVRMANMCDDVFKLVRNVKLHHDRRRYPLQRWELHKRSSWYKNILSPFLSLISKRGVRSSRG